MANLAKIHPPRAGSNQWLQTFYDELKASGRVWWVGSGYANATDGTGFGFTPEAPLKTINYAVATACVPDNNDLVLVMPGHTETITAATGVGMSVAGVRVRGIGKSPRQHTVNFTTAIAASFDITAARCTVENLAFTCGFDALTAMMNVTAADVTIDGCEWQISDGTNGAVLGMLTAATATRLRVLNSRFIGPAINAGTTCTACIDHEVGIDYQIDNCFFQAKCTQAITNGATILGGVINNNRFVVSGTVCVNMAAASTPLIVNNRFHTVGGTAPVVAAAGFVVGNSYSAAVGVTAGTALTF